MEQHLAWGALLYHLLRRDPPGAPPWELRGAVLAGVALIVILPHLTLGLR
ncbi:MAG: hypothetical protein ACK6AH_10385 [Gemmatimonadota bacterium]